MNYRRRLLFANNYGNQGTAATAFFTPFTISHTKVGATNSANFPYTFFDNAGLARLKTVANGGFVQNALGYDLQWYSDAALTIPVPYQLVFYDGTTGKWEMKVLTQLSSAVDTTYYLKYGDKTVTTNGSSTTVWDTNCVAQYSFANGTALSLTDGTSNANTGTNQAATAIAGQVDGGMRTDTAKWATAPNSAALNSCTTAMTISMLINPDSVVTGGNKFLVARYDASNTFFDQNVGNLEWQLNGTQAISSTNPLTAAWQHVAGTYDGTTMTLVRNGVSVATAAKTGSLTWSGDATGFGGRASDGNFTYPGGMDEIRISKSARSIDWLIAEYNNLVNYSTSVTVGAQQAAGFNPDAEPVFNSATQTKLFDNTTALNAYPTGYAGWASAALDSWQSALFNGPPPTWVTLTAYPTGAVVRNPVTTGPAYICTTGGTSGALGPSGTGPGITDGTCVWTGQNAPFGNLQDTTESQSTPANSVLAVGPGGAGTKALSLAYLGNYPGQPVHALSITSFFDAIAGKPGHDFFFQYYFRIRPGVYTDPNGGATPGNPVVMDVSVPGRSMQIKGNELVSTNGGSARAQFFLGGAACGRTDNPFVGAQISTLGSFYGNGGNDSDCAAGQVRAPFFYAGTNAWHRLTFRYRTATGVGGPQPARPWFPNFAYISTGPDPIASTNFQVQNNGILYQCTTSGTSGNLGGPTGTGTGIADPGSPNGLVWKSIAVPAASTTTVGIGNNDGLAQWWMDGTLIVSVGASYVNQVVPNGINTGSPAPPRWCQLIDLQQMFINDPVTRLTLASVFANVAWQFDLDYGPLVAWRN